MQLRYNKTGKFTNLSILIAIKNKVKNIYSEGVVSAIRKHETDKARSTQKLQTGFHISAFCVRLVLNFQNCNTEPMETNTMENKFALPPIPKGRDHSGQNIFRTMLPKSTDRYALKGVDKHAPPGGEPNYKQGRRAPEECLLKGKT